MKVIYEQGDKLILKKKSAKHYNVFQSVKILFDTDIKEDFFIVEAYRMETDELIELIIEKNDIRQ